ncbi:MAG TPA: type IV pilus assembly protein PilM [Solirubrobacteraceae bacterium]|jgi:type IV pilus assembly protein PilM|nr:type IV pilus assembly protein PilM [Solirubrobacteraceae bacterium]
MLDFLKQPVSLKRPTFKRSSAPEAPGVAETSGAPEAPSRLRRSVSFKRPSAPKLPSVARPSGLGKSGGRKKPAGLKKPGGLNKQVSFKQLTSMRVPSASSLLSGGAPRPSRSRPLVGLEIEPGQLIAAQSRVNGHVVVERAAGKPIPANIVRDGEVSDVAALTTALEELFEGSGLDKRVRIGIANQRIVMRQMELPPITDPKELQNAVYFQAQDEIPMPIDSVVLDFHTLGIADTTQGPRMQVLLVAARRDMVERMLEAARAAGLRPEGVDLAAFGMIRALRPLDAAEGEQVLYLSIGGLTNLAIATGATCQFTRVITTGIEHIVAEVAANAGVPLADARRLVAGAGPESAESAGEASVSVPLTASPSSKVEQGDNDAVARAALSDGVRRIAAEVRNSLDFHLASAHGAGAVTRAVLTGPALDVPGFDLALGRELGLTLDRGAVEVANEATAGHVPMSRLAVAAGLSVPEGPQQ